MTFKEKVFKTIEEILQDKQRIFLIDITVTDAFKITVTLDGDDGIVLQDCIDVSREIDEKLDREEQDYSLEVASAGIGSALKIPRQYVKNIGRTLIVKTVSEKFEAKLTDANDTFIVLSWQAREPKKTGKGKETVQKRIEIPYKDIIESVVTITF